ncbi:MAG TPA: polysaccharide pyruvyl transferase family protein [Roseimicrobium sp.]|nr:polysaccharide pyruvyl transferase family protein [Roseimicrobium sp.]
MNIGVLEFRYGRPKKSPKSSNIKKEYSVNIGDSIQSLTVRTLLAKMGVPNHDIIAIDRDAITSYNGPPARLILNACFYTHCFPLPPQIQPIFIGFQTSDPEVISLHADYFRRHQPIGCRDNDTRNMFIAHGIDAYTTGCLTMSIPLRTESPPAPKVLFIGGGKSGIFPPTLKDFAPLHVLESSTYIYQRSPVATFPLTDAEVDMSNLMADQLLARYRSTASLVVTPLLHAACPCIASGIPVILARKDHNTRFSAINRVLPVYEPSQFASIDWSPKTVDLEPLKACLRSLLINLLNGLPPGIEERHFLSEFYEKRPVLP